MGLMWAVNDSYCLSLLLHNTIASKLNDLLLSVGYTPGLVLCEGIASRYGYFTRYWGFLFAGIAQFRRDLMRLIWVRSYIRNCLSFTPKRFVRLKYLTLYSKIITAGIINWEWNEPLRVFILHTHFRAVWKRFGHTITSGFWIVDVTIILKFVEGKGEIGDNEGWMSYQEA